MRCEVWYCCQWEVFSISSSAIASRVQEILMAPVRKPNVPNVGKCWRKPILHSWSQIISTHKCFWPFNIAVVSSSLLWEKKIKCELFMSRPSSCNSKSGFAELSSVMLYHAAWILDVSCGMTIQSLHLLTESMLCCATRIVQSWLSTSILELLEDLFWMGNACICWSHMNTMRTVIWLHQDTYLLLWRHVWVGNA